MCAREVKGASGILTCRVLKMKLLSEIGKACSREKTRDLSWTSLGSLLAVLKRCPEACMVSLEFEREPQVIHCGIVDA